MPTPTPEGEIEARDLIPPDEGALKQIYGRIGNFKTYFATLKALELLDRGQVVKVNWKIDWNGYDERTVWYFKLAGLFGFKTKFWEYPKENLEYYSIMPEWARTHGYKDFHEWLAHQTNCHIFIDEGHIVYDSYKLTRMSMEERVMILATRHYDRSIWIVSQRPSAIHVNYRANVNQFFKCEALETGFFGRRSFMVTEFQDTNESDKPDETREEIHDPETGEVTEWKYKLAVSSETYTAKKEIFDRYDSKYLRAGMKDSQRNMANVVEHDQEWWVKNIWKK